MVRLFIKHRLQSVLENCNKLEDAAWILHSSKLQLNGKSFQLLLSLIMLARNPKTVFFTLLKYIKGNLWKREYVWLANKFSASPLTCPFFSNNSLCEYFTQWPITKTKLYKTPQKFRILYIKRDMFRTLSYI